jgi:glycosyltransferase involved in cell wall biosynthesis
MSQAHRIAVVLPTYNRAALLGRAIESVLSQQRRPHELIVVDDGSTDDTTAVVSRFGDAVRYVVSRHGGAAAARNRGVEYAQSPFVAFLDSDDYWDSGHLRRMGDAIEATEGSAWLYFSNIALAPPRDAHPSIWDACGFTCADPLELRENASEWALLPRQPMMTPAVLVRRDTYLKIGGQTEHLRYREDTHFFLKLGLSGPLCAVQGIAGSATADDPGRLTELARTQHRSRYWSATAWLYTDILAGGLGLSAGERAILRRRLSHAHVELARIAFPGKPISAVAQVLLAARTDRDAVLERLRGRTTISRLRSGRSETSRPELQPRPVGD